MATCRASTVLSSSLIRTSKTTTKSRRSRCSVHGSASLSSLCLSLLPLASAPRTVEIMWGGVTAPGFTLKRKHSGIILVSAVTRETQVTTMLQIGSELRLVGGFPIHSLTLKDVKQVMGLAPKPVSLVFVNASDALDGNCHRIKQLPKCALQKKVLPRLAASTTISSARSRHHTNVDRSTVREKHGVASDSASSIVPFYCTPSKSIAWKKMRKGSKLPVARIRMNQLLNRPVRRASLHLAAHESIVV